MRVFFLNLSSEKLGGGGFTLLCPKVNMICVGIFLKIEVCKKGTSYMQGYYVLGLICYIKCKLCHTLCWEYLSVPFLLFSSL